MHRQERQRLAAKPPPKLERHRLLPVNDNRVTYHWGALAEETTVPSEGRYARDEAELLVLANFVGSGALTVESLSSISS
jgi:hypothetical protein